MPGEQFSLSVTQSLYRLTLFAEWGRGLMETGAWPKAQEWMERIGEIALYRIAQEALNNALKVVVFVTAIDRY